MALVVVKGMFNLINSSILNSFTTVQELSRTPENTQGQLKCSSKIKDMTSFDNKFKESPQPSGRLETIVRSKKASYNQSQIFLPPRLRNTCAKRRVQFIIQQMEILCLRKEDLTHCILFTLCQHLNCELFEVLPFYKDLTV